MRRGRRYTLPHTRRIGAVRNGHTITKSNDGAKRHGGEPNGHTTEGSAGVTESYEGSGEPRAEGVTRTRQHGHATPPALFQIHRAGNTRVQRTPTGALVELVGGGYKNGGAIER